MFRHKYPDEDFDRSAQSSRNAMSLCSAIVEDAEEARRFEFPRSGAMDLHGMMRFAPSEIRHGAAPLASELTSLVA